MGKLSLKLKKTPSKTDGKEKASSQTSIQSFFSKAPAVKPSPLFSSVGDSTAVPIKLASPTPSPPKGKPKVIHDVQITAASHVCQQSIPESPNSVPVVTPKKVTKLPPVVPETPEQETTTAGTPPASGSPSPRKVLSLRRKRSLSPGSSPPAKEVYVESPCSRPVVKLSRLSSAGRGTGKASITSTGPNKARANPFTVVPGKSPQTDPIDILSQYTSTPLTTNAAVSLEAPVKTRAEASSASVLSAMQQSDSARHSAVIGLYQSNSVASKTKKSSSSTSLPLQCLTATGLDGNTSSDDDKHNVSMTDEELLQLCASSSQSPYKATRPSPAPGNTQRQHSSPPVRKRTKLHACSSPLKTSHVRISDASLQEPLATDECVMNGSNDVPTTPRKAMGAEAAMRTPGNVSLDAEDYTMLLESCLQMTPIKTANSQTKPSASVLKESLEESSQGYRRFLVLEVYSRDATVSNGQVSWNVNEKVLRLLDERHSLEQQCLLRDDWLQTVVEPGDVAHVSGKFNDDGVCLLSNTAGGEGYLVTQPDTLISTTSVAMATRCMRRAVLGERFKGGGSDVTEALLVGVMLHEIFDLAMKAANFSVEYTRKLAEEVSQRQDFLHMMYAAQQTKSAILEKIIQQLATLQEWSGKFLHENPKVAMGLLDMASTFQSSSEEKQSLAISKLQDIEENIWSPRFGLKGKVDATVEVKIHRRKPIGSRKNQPQRNTPVDEKMCWSQVPLELKTGRQTSSLGTVDHRAQVILYTLMLSDCHKLDVPAGLLLYSKTGKLLSVPSLSHELRALLMRRNELARYLSLASSSSSAWSAHLGAGLLPAMLRDEHTCKYCPQLATCALLHRSVENGTTESSGIGNHFQDNTDHLSAKQFTFFADWYRLIGLEASCASGDNSTKNIWTVPAEDRIAANQCFGNLRVAKAELRDGSASWRIRFSVSKHADGDESGSLHDVPISAGEMIVLSEQGGRVALCTGFLLDVGSEHVDVALDRQVPSCGEEGDVVLYCVDGNSSLNAGGALWGNLAQLFIATEDRDSRLRSLIVDLSPPRFARSSLLSQSNQSQLPCTFSAQHFQSFSAQADKMDQVEEILETLNSDQRHAIDRALCAQDYALILGMPGTGKTTTIACLVEILVLCGKSVLLASYTHSAVDNILLKLIKNGVDFVRLGRTHKVHPEVQPYTAEVACSQFSTVSQLEEFYRLKKVMATTCHGIGHNALARNTFDVCIIDEASQITLPMCLGPLRLAETFVLVGDQYQLPPLVQSTLARDGGMAVSLFRRLAEAHPAAVINLQHQYRMHSDIMLLSNTLVYSHRLKCGTDQVASSLLSLPDWPSLSNESQSVSEWLRNTLNPCQPVVFLNTDKIPGPEQTGLGLVYNEVEASLVALLVKSLLTAGALSQDIGVISIYRQQLKVISSLLQQTSSEDVVRDGKSSSCASTTATSMSNAIEVNTVDRYQGRDKPCVIVSLVRSNATGKVGQLLLDWRRANVAVTRAKHKLILIGSASTLRCSNLFKLLLDLVVEREWVIDVPSNGHTSISR